MDQGPAEQKIIEQCARSGWDLPEKIKNAPSLLPGLELYYIAFMSLEASRQIGMGAGPIWWTTVQDYCERQGLDEEQTEAMHIHIKAMDTAYLKNLARKNK